MSPSRWYATPATGCCVPGPRTEYLQPQETPSPLCRPFAHPPLPMCRKALGKCCLSQGSPLSQHLQTLPFLPFTGHLKWQPLPERWVQLWNPNSIFKSKAGLWHEWTSSKSHALTSLMEWSHAHSWIPEACYPQLGFNFLFLKQKSLLCLFLIFHCWLLLSNRNNGAFSLWKSISENIHPFVS